MFKLKSLALLLLFAVLMVAVPYGSDAKTKAPPCEETVQPIQCFDVVSFDVNHFETNDCFTNLAAIETSSTDCYFDKSSHVYLIGQARLNLPKTIIFEVLKKPGNKINKNVFYANYNVKHLKPISHYSC